MSRSVFAPTAKPPATTNRRKPLRHKKQCHSGLICIDRADVPPGTRVILTAFDGTATDSRVIQTQPVNEQELLEFRSRIRRLESEAEAESRGWVQQHRASP